MPTRHKIDLATEEFRHARRTFTVERAAIDEKNRTVSLSFASEEPVDRWYGREILDCSNPQACDLSRLRNGGALLVNHDWHDQVGVVMAPEIDTATKKARCMVKLSRSERGEEIWQDIQDGIRTLISVGYVVRKMVLQSVEGDVETHRVTEWTPFEVSIVAVPADVSVGIGRNLPQTNSRPAAIPSAMPDNSPAGSAPATSTETRAAAPAAAATPATVQVNDRAAELARIKSLNTAARDNANRYPQHADAIRDLAAKCGETGDTIDAFNRCLLNDILGTQRDLAPVTQDHGASTLGLSRKEVGNYSILRAIRLLADGRPLDGAEREFSDEVSKRLGIQPRGFFMPEDVVRDRRNRNAASRGLLATSPVDGGYTIQSEVLGGELVQLLRNQAKVVGLGARVITGLKGDITIPRQLTGAVAYWVSETGSITDSAATFGQIVGRPRRLGTNVPYSKQFLAQTSLDAEGFVINDSDEAIAVEIDRVCIAGNGGAEPLGILNLPAGVRCTDVTFGGAATWAKYLEFFGNVATANAAMGRLGYLTTPAAAVKAMSIAKFTNGDVPIWTPDGKIGMFPADWSNQFPTTGTLNQVIFGDWSQEIILEWAGRDVVVDPFTAKKAGNVEVCIQRLVDVVTRRGKGLCVSSDTAAA